ncbi:MAG: XRE family transcriptional regulator [Thermodesulfobacteriota bacterium]
MSTLSFASFYKKATALPGVGSQSDLAAVLGVHRSSITQAKRKNTVPDAWLLKVIEHFQLDPSWLRTESGGGPPLAAFTREAVTAVPRVRARLHAGGGSFETSPEVESFFAFRRSWLRRKGDPDKMVLMDVVGDSMSPTIEEGDTVLVDQSRTDIYAGGIYALGIDDTVMVKRLEKHPGRLVLISANSRYAPVYLQGEEINRVRVIGRVIWICRELG